MGVEKCVGVLPTVRRDCEYGCFRQPAAQRPGRLWGFVDQRRFGMQGFRQLTKQWMGWRFCQLPTGSFLDSQQMGGEMSFEVLVGKYSETRLMCSWLRSFPTKDVRIVLYQDFHV